jgi:hypothetical protein
VVKNRVGTNPEFRHEDEPDRVLGLHEPYEIKFRDSSTQLHNGIQIYYNISRLYRYLNAGDDGVLTVLQSIILPIRNTPPTRAPRLLIRILWPLWCLS